MGRPVRRDVFGVEVFGDYTTGSVGIKCEAYIGGNNESDVFIVKQKASRKYKVQDKSASTTVVAKLVSGTPAADGEMRLTGYAPQAGGGRNEAAPIYLAKLNKRLATDFSGNRYTWRLINDSSADYIELTLVDAV
jgi:hypothetical protein